MTDALAASQESLRMRRPAWPLVAALVLGIAIVAAWCVALRDYRYAYSGDSASYIEMAQSLRTDGHPRVSPWALESPDVDAIPQPVFPPGLPVIIAALAPFAGDVATAATWPNRIAAALLPLLVLVMFRGLLPDGALLGIGLWVLLSPGVLKWHFVAYTDVVAAALAVVSLGALIRARGRALRWLALAGFTAGIAYAVRNAALALLVASAAALAYDAVISRGATIRAAFAWLGAAALPLAALAAYNLSTFGALQPYDMPASRRGWTDNLADWVKAQLADQHVPEAWLERIGFVGAATLVAVLLVAALRWWWGTRDDASTHRAVTALGLYVVAGGAMLVVSRSRYEWADTIELRHALQYTWAFTLLAVLAARRLPAGLRRAAARAATVAIALAALGAIATARDTRASTPESWLVVSRDPAVTGALRALPQQTLIASNASVLFRIASGRPVRLVEFGGGDAAFAGALATIAAAAGPRPSAYVLWCHSWTAAASACAPQPRDAGPSCRRLRGPPEIVALCRTDGGGSSRTGE